MAKVLKLGYFQASVAYKKRMYIIFYRNDSIMINSFIYEQHTISEAREAYMPKWNHLGVCLGYILLEFTGSDNKEWCQPFRH